MRKILFGIIFFGLFSSCKSQFSTSELKNNFTKNEIEDLVKIRNFFKSEICTDSIKIFETCFREIPHDYLEAYGEGFWVNINFEKQKELYNQISESTFKKIWTFCKTEYRTEPNKKYKSLCVVANSNYLNYLTEIGNDNPRITEYAKWINDSGDISSMFLKTSEILKNKKYINLKDPNIQLLIAIQYLTLNDQFKRKEEWVE